MKPPSRYSRIEEFLKECRENLVNHTLFSRVNSLPDIRNLLQHEVFAIWVRSNLISAVVEGIMGPRTPWAPRGDVAVREAVRFLEKIVNVQTNLAGTELSLLELAIEAMRPVGADLSRIVRFLDRLGRGDTPMLAAEIGKAPKPAQFLIAKCESTMAGTTLPGKAAYALVHLELLFLTLQQARSISQLCGLGDSTKALRHLLAQIARIEPLRLKQSMQTVFESLCRNEPSAWEETRRMAIEAARAHFEYLFGICQALPERRDIITERNIPETNNPDANIPDPNVIQSQITKKIIIERKNSSEEEIRAFDNFLSGNLLSGGVVKEDESENLDPYLAQR